MDQITQAQTSGLRPVVEKEKHYHMPLVLGFVLIVILGISVWHWWNQNKKTISPEQQLLLLRESSRPVSQSEEGRLQELKILQEESASVNTTTESQLDILESLSRPE